MDDLLDHCHEVGGIGLHDGIELGEFAGTEEDTGDTELEIVFVETEGLEEGFAEGTWIEGGKLGWEHLGVHVVEILEGSTGWETTLHEVEDGDHACTLKLGENLTTAEDLGLHLLVGLDATNEG